MCTNRRPFKSAKVKTFSNFHAVPCHSLDGPGCRHGASAGRVRLGEAHGVGAGAWGEGALRRGPRPQSAGGPPVLRLAVTASLSLPVSESAARRP